MISLTSIKIFIILLHLECTPMPVHRLLHLSTLFIQQTLSIYPQQYLCFALFATFHVTNGLLTCAMFHLYIQ